jgi:hypothetical protein
MDEWIASEMDPYAFGAISKRVASSLKDQSESCLEKRSDARIEQLIAHVNIEKPPNARERKTGCHVAPRLLGSVLFSDAFVAAIELLVPPAPPIQSAPDLKARCFDFLSDLLLQHCFLCSSAELIAAFGHIPSSSHNASLEASGCCASVQSAFFRLENLVALGFRDLDSCLWHSRRRQRSLPLRPSVPVRWGCADACAVTSHAFTHLTDSLMSEF